jgi:hypothetical protein
MQSMLSIFKMKRKKDEIPERRNVTEKAYEAEKVMRKNLNNSERLRAMLATYRDSNAVVCVFISLTE